jgi:ABC-2 type transport system ATP-binding protein
MDDQVAVRIDGVSKTFKLPHEKNTSIKNALVNIGRRNKSYEVQQVLEDITFDIRKGEFFGIVGRNGSGKSTLLKILAGIYTPTKGSVHYQGKLTPFIELGVGFNPELTGRENVFLNGALLGFGRKEMMELYDDIVAFAELEKFMDQKLKNYSSGMQVRLAFSIAIRAQSDILVLDEVLAVGDEAFQQKCIRVFDDYKKNKKTVILVTHDMETVKKYCSQAILINEGHIIKRGSPHEVAAKYSKLNQPKTVEEPEESTNSDIRLRIMNRKDRQYYKYGEKLQVKLKWNKNKPVDTAGIALHASTGECVYATNTTLDGISLKGTNEILYEVELKVGAGNYFVMAGTFKGANHAVVDFTSEGPSLSVDMNEDNPGEGFANLPHAWKVV